MTVLRTSVRISGPRVAHPALAVVTRPSGRSLEDGFDAPPRPRSAPLRRGAVGPGVRALQERLVRAGALSAADVSTGPGVYGPRTEAGVKRFQASVGLPCTGVATPETLEALRGDGWMRGRRSVVAGADEATTQPISRAAVQARLAETFTDEEPGMSGAGL